MERPKIKNRTNKKDNDISLKVFCVTPTITSSEEHDTSVYEIDIQSDFEFHNNGKMKTKEGPIVSINGVSNTDWTEKNNKKAAKKRDSSNPFFQSYYPNFLETYSEENETQSEMDESKSKDQIQVVEEKKEAVIEKLDKENQSPSVHSNSRLQQHIKSYLIENFFSKNNSDLKAMFQNYENKLDTNELHLHHHEHHHHYYYNNPFNEKSSSSNSGKECEKNKNEEDRSHEERHEEFVGQSQEADIIYHCAGMSNTTFTQVKLRPDSNGTQGGQEGGAKASGNSSALHLKTSISVESVFNKKSDFIKSHVYSDTDLAKCDSAELIEIVKDPNKNSGSNYNMLVDSMRNLNQFKSPLVITDQENVPKFSYITCECTSVETLGKLSSITLVNSDNLEELEESERTLCESDESVKDTG